MRTFSESLDALEIRFVHLNLDEQFAFIEWFRPFIAKMKDEFRRFVVGQLCDYLEQQMMSRLDDWLRAEMNLQ